MCHNCVHPLSLEKEITAYLYWRVLSLEWPRLCHIYLKDILSVWAQALSRNHVYLWPYLQPSLFCLNEWRTWIEMLSQELQTLVLVREESRTLWRGGSWLWNLFLFTFLLQLKVMSVCCFSKQNHFFSSVRQGCAKRSKVTHTRTQSPIGSVWQLKILPSMP